MERLDQRAIDRIAGDTWEKARPAIEGIHDALIGASATVCGTLTTIYVKYVEESKSDPFAVLWIKSSKKIVLGFSLPEDFAHDDLLPPIARHTYKGLTKYLVWENGSELPADLSLIAQTSHGHTYDNA